VVSIFLLHPSLASCRRYSAAAVANFKTAIFVFNSSKKKKSSFKLQL
jgi:hypothetical protein